jgi:hypothetical protein
MGANLLDQSGDIGNCDAKLLVFSGSCQVFVSVGVNSGIHSDTNCLHHFLRTSNGAELDLVLERGQRRRVYEIKLSKAPKLSRGFHELVQQLQPERAELIAPVDGSYAVKPGIWVRSPLEASQPTTAP